MAKLQAPKSAGFNAGENYYAKLFPIDDIVINPKIAGIFNISDKTLKEIQERIEKFGYNKEEPAVIWKGKNILVDGRTRYTAAKNAGLKEIPVVEKEFENMDAAILYTFERQAVRRNITGAEIMVAAETLPNERKSSDGTGREAELLAERLGCSASTVYQARALLKEGTKEDIQAVKKGKKSLKKAYSETKQRLNPEKKFAVTDAQGLPGNIGFLKSAIMLLVEAGNQEKAISLLLNHFLKKNEKSGFYALLPKNISRQLPKLPLLVRQSE